MESREKNGKKEREKNEVGRYSRREKLCRRGEKMEGRKRLQGEGREWSEGGVIRGKERGRMFRMPRRKK